MCSVLEKYGGVSNGLAFDPRSFPVPFTNSAITAPEIGHCWTFAVVLSVPPNGRTVPCPHHVWLPRPALLPVWKETLSTHLACALNPPGQVNDLGYRQPNTWDTQALTSPPLAVLAQLFASTSDCHPDLHLE